MIILIKVFRTMWTRSSFNARFTGYEVYEELNYSISYPSIGDCLDRYILRFIDFIKLLSLN